MFSISQTTQEPKDKNTVIQSMMLRASLLNTELGGEGQGVDLEGQKTNILHTWLHPGNRRQSYITVLSKCVP